MSTDKPTIIKLAFCEPYRLVEWCDRGNRDLYQRYLRGRSFAQWVKNCNDNKGKLRITGTLVRSAVIRATEELLSLSGGIWEGEKCCQGQFTTEGKKPFLLRKRPTIDWKSDRICNDADACPFCHLLGRFDGAGRNHKENNYPIEKYFIHFGNIYLDGCFPSHNIKDIASERILNRVDYKTNKAQDYFKVWEVDHEDYPVFTGKITVQPSAYKARELLKASLGFVDKLCGAMCRIEVVEGNRVGEIGNSVDLGSHSPFDSAQDDAKSNNRKESFAKSNEITVQLRKQVKEIVSAFKGKNIKEKVRTLADVVRAMRLKGSDILGNLPRGRDGKKHHLWDVDIGDSNLRDVLNTLWQNNRDRFTWREFCERLGNEIYLQYKEETGGVSVQFRILGDTEYYSKPDKTGQASDFFIPITRTGNVAEWIIIGKLNAETPFYFGVQQSFGSNQTASADDAQGRDTFAEGLNAEISEQTSFRILLDKEGRYRIPRSLMRGALRRDLNTAFGGSGCTMDLGGAIPCVCPVCIIMRRITIKDSRSDCVEPPDMRYRIRMNPETSTVDEGALFDMEIGPEDITFPFVLRYRGEGVLPSELWSILRYWKDGMSWLGGSSSTGKGRFSLEGIKIYQWDLNGDGLTSYIDEKGLRGNELDIKNDKLPSGLKPPVGLPDNSKIYEPYQKYLKPQWQEVTYTMEIAAPLLSADTIAALLDPDNRDSIAYRKRVWDAEKKELAHKFTIKGETIRGIVRTAVGKQNGLLDKEHKECDCTLCTVFGNEHEAGKIRFEDLEVKIKDGEIETAPNCKKIDHVAIDRFTGGAVDKKKFDTYPIAGSPHNPICLKGTFWMRRDLTDTEKEFIGDALLDIKQGLYPIGGKTGIGYGWVSHLEIANPPDFFKLEETKMSKISTGEPYKFPNEPPSLPDGKDQVYYPHYFLKPDEYVDNKLEQIGHEKFDKGLLTGKIECNLETLTPLIIPDTEDEDAFGLQKDHPGHKNFKFFRINKDVMIPGSEIRGTISSVYEALTNSCFRILDEKKYISWRMKPEEFAGNPKKNIKGFKPGLIKKDNGQLKVIEVETYRLPLYDDQSKTKIIDLPTFKDMVAVSEDKLNNAIKVNNEIASAATENRNYLLQNFSEQDRKEVLSGKKEVTFEERPINFMTKEKDGKEHKICIDKIAILTNASEKDLKKGFIKFTGPNNANVSNTDEDECGFDDKWNIWDLNILLGNIPATADEFRKSNKQYYPRPYLNFIKNEVEYSISKRCERIFLQPDTKNGYPIPTKICNQYKEILKDYHEYRKKVDEDVRENICTNIINEELSAKDLVYFHLNDSGVVDAIIPVCISRKSASKTISEKIPNNLCPCERGMAKGGDIESDTGARPFSTHPDGLCPACRLFGTTDYKGRVRFGFAKQQDKNSLMWYNNGQPLTFPLLESPRPTWSMPDDTYDVPGRKFYVHHNGWKDVKDEGKTKNNCTVETIDKGSKFQFEIFFENLEGWELGILLYSLELEPKLAHKIGKAKAFGFGSVQIRVDKILLRGLPDDKGNKKNWLNTGFNQLKTWFDKTSLDAVTHIHNLRLFLRFPDDGQSRRVQYPELAGEKGLPGYVELGKKENWPFKDRINCLTTPWSPWHPHATPKDDKQESKSEIKDTITPGNSIVHKEDQRKHTPKPKIPLTNKCSGIIKSFEKNSEIVVAKENGGDIHVWYYEKTVLNVGQKIKFRVEQGAMFTKIYDVEIVK